MASKPLIIASMIGATIGVPYVASRSSSNHNVAQNSAVASPAIGPTQPNPAPGPNPVSPSIVSSPPVEVTRSPSVDQALRFDVTKEWVYGSWDRKSTGPTDVGLFAVRVVLVSGTQNSSLAGSLTYYFNTQNQVEHISFRGRTGDPARLVQFLTHAYQLQPIAAPPGEQLYQVTKGGRVQSELRTRPESVVSTTSPHSSFSVELELARPGSKRFLPPRGPRLELPPVAASTPPEAATSAAANSTTSGTPTGTFLDKFRHATPQEETQALGKRWPN